MAEVEDVVFPYLQSKFSSILQDVEAGRNNPSRIINRFKSIEGLIKSKSCPTPPFAVNHLYDLITELSECRSRSAVLSRTAPFRVNPVSKFFLTNRMVKRLDDIEKKLKNHPAVQSTEATLARSVPIQQTSPAIPAVQSTEATRARSVPIQQTSPAIDTSGIIGFYYHTKTIEHLLLQNSTDRRTNEDSEGIRSIGIVGMSGCGKTALAQKVFASPTIQENFSPRIWVSLSGMLLDTEKRKDTRVRVLNHILQEIGHGISDETGVAKLLEKLQRALIGKRYLIVLDDVWRADEWFLNLGHCLPRGHATTGTLFSHGLPGGSGGGVIVTSRLQNFVTRMVGKKDVIWMEANMNKDNCLEIFNHVAGKMDESWKQSRLTTELENDIIRKCAGLPLAVRTLANVIPPLVAVVEAQVHTQMQAGAGAEAGGGGGARGGGIN